MCATVRLAMFLVLAAQAPGDEPNLIDTAPSITIIEGPSGPVAVSPPLIVVAPGGYFYGPIPGPTIVPAVPTPMVVPPPVYVPSAPLIPTPAITPPVRLPVMPTALRRPSASRAADLIHLGDRHFRAGDLRRASQRYDQAIAAHPGSGEPRARLAQVELSRGRYREAVDRLRQAQTAEPGWIAFAANARNLYPEPAQYHAMIAKIEAHLQARPMDRDAWTMLGVQWLLSGERQRAADVFLRLSDQPPDALMETLLKFTGAQR